jgi:hypothetical protein
VGRDEEQRGTRERRDGRRHLRGALKRRKRY